MGLALKHNFAVFALNLAIFEDSKGLAIGYEAIFSIMLTNENLDQDCTDGTTVSRVVKTPFLYT